MHFFTQVLAASPLAHAVQNVQTRRGKLERFDAASGRWEARMENLKKLEGR